MHSPLAEDHPSLHSEDEPTKLDEFFLLVYHRKELTPLVQKISYACEWDRVRIRTQTVTCNTVPPSSNLLGATTGMYS